MVSSARDAMLRWTSVARDHALLAPRWPPLRDARAGRSACTRRARRVSCYAKPSISTPRFTTWRWLSSPCTSASRVSAGLHAAAATASTCAQGLGTRAAMGDACSAVSDGTHGKSLCPRISLARSWPRGAPGAAVGQPVPHAPPPCRPTCSLRCRAPPAHPLPQLDDDVGAPRLARRQLQDRDDCNAQRGGAPHRRACLAVRGATATLSATRPRLSLAGCAILLLLLFASATGVALASPLVCCVSRRAASTRLLTDSRAQETISTCRFAQRVARVTNDAFVNEEADPRLVIRRLKAEVKALKAEVAFLKGQAVRAPRRPRQRVVVVTAVVPLHACRMRAVFWACAAAVWRAHVAARPCRAAMRCCRDCDHAGHCDVLRGACVSSSQHLLLNCCDLPTRPPFSTGLSHPNPRSVGWF